AVLIDTRPDDSGRSGLIIEHPELKDENGASEFYVDEAAVAELDSIREQPKDHTIHHLDSYQDPVTDSNGDPLIAVAEPVEFPQTQNQTRSSGWFVLIQEDRAKTLEPITILRTRIFWGIAIALVVVVLVLVGLWWLVVYVQNAPSRLRASQLWTGHLTGGSTSSTYTG
ncbi:MAG: hypothetical protein KDA84_12800, partial [Planctomycetaceae bacterium]|nr:hypothetical protein [Planctomycetaceae bacterium]